MRILHSGLAFLATFSSCHVQANNAANVFSNARGTTMYNTDINNAARDINIRQNIIEQSDGPLVKLMNASAPGALYNSRERDPPPRCLDGTRISQLNRIAGWALSDSSDAKPIMWLKGGAGAGKSSIAQTVAESYAQNGLLGATFFFQQGHSTRSSAERVFPTFALQLALSNETTRDLIQAVIINDPLILENKAMDVQFDELVLRPFKQMAARSTQKRIFIIDALDECGDQAMLSRLLRVIRNNVETNSSPFRFLVTSRPEFRLEAFFRTIRHLHEYIDLRQSPEAKHDIRKYLNKEFSDIHMKHSDVLPPQGNWPSLSDIEWIVDRASGHFIYAATVVKFVDYDFDNPAHSLDFIRGRVASVDSSRRPYVELDQLYRAILNRAAATQDQKNLVSLLAIYASTATNIEELQSNDTTAAIALGVQMEDVRLLLRGLRSLIGPVTYSWPWGDITGFLHLSFSDFILDPSRSVDFYIGGQDHQLYLEYVHWKDTNFHVAKFGADGRWRITSGCGSDPPPQIIARATEAINAPLHVLRLRLQAFSYSSDSATDAHVFSPLLAAVFVILAVSRDVLFLMKCLIHRNAGVHILAAIIWMLQVFVLSRFTRFYAEAPVHTPSQHGFTTPILVPPSTECSEPLKPLQPWMIKNFTLDQSGKIIPIEYTSNYTKPHRLSIVDIDKQDLKMNIYINDILRGRTSETPMDPRLDCGVDLRKCLTEGYSAGVVNVPPGKQAVRIEIAPNSDGCLWIRWSEERVRRILMQKVYCA